MLSPWSVFKGHTGMSSRISFFLGKVIWRWRLLHPKTASADDCWEDEGLGPRSSESAVRWGEARWSDRRNGWKSFRPSHWQSRRIGESGVSVHCQRTPCCHLWMKGEINGHFLSGENTYMKAYQLVLSISNNTIHPFFKITACPCQGNGGV